MFDFSLFAPIEGNVLPVLSTSTHVMCYHVKTKLISAGGIYAAASMLRVLRHAVGDTYTLYHHRCKATVFVLLACKSVDLNGTGLILTYNFQTSNEPYYNNDRKRQLLS